MVKTGQIFVSGWLQDRGSSFAAERSVESGLCRCNHIFMVNGQNACILIRLLRRIYAA